MPDPVPVWVCDGQHDEEVARFVLESDDFVNDIVIGARDELRVLTRYRYLGFAAALAAAATDTEPLTTAIEAIYLHLRYDYQLVYELEHGFNPVTGEQRVRLPAHVSRHNGGTCIDLVLLFLSCLAFPKLRPIYVQLRGRDGGHALAGAWMRDPPPATEHFLLLDDLAALRRRVENNQVLLLECTGYSEGYSEHPRGLTFADAREKARRTLARTAAVEAEARRRGALAPREFGFALDVMAAWEAGFYPDGATRGQGRPSGDSAFQEKGAVPEQLRDHFAYPFNAFMVSRTRGFVGRDFVFRELDDFLAHERSGYFIIRGQPGIGKSALAAQLVRTRGYLHHFNIALQGINTPRQFLTHVCTQLIVRFQLPYNALPDDAGENGRFLAVLLEEASRKLTGGEKLVLVIDAFDEVHGGPRSANVLFLPPHLPDSTYVVLTGRDQQDLTLRVEPARTFHLRPDSEGNRQDVRDYVQARLPDLRIQAWMAARRLGAEAFVEQMLLGSEGNFMYLHHVLPAIAAGRFDLGLDDLPHGLEQYYRQHWKQMQRQDVELFDRQYQPVVCVLAAAREAVSAEQVAEWTGLAPPQVRRVLGEWREFLDEQRGKDRARLYRVYHGTFRQWLQDEVDPGLTTYHAMIDDAIERKLMG